MFDDILDRPVATRMVELRRKQESWFWFMRSPHPNKRPGFELWRAPEYAILSLAKSFAALRQDGLSERDALERIDERRKLGVLDDKAASFEAYVRLVLARHAPQYLEFGDRLLRQVVTMAQEETARRYATQDEPRERSGKDLGDERIPVEEFLDQLKTAKRLQGPMLFPRSGFDELLAQFLVRLQEGDEIWRWSTPPAMWRMRIGRGGVRLVRENRALATVLTVMN